MLKLTPQQESDHEQAEICHICEKAFDDNKKVHDHCHLTGQYRGAAHNQCNLKFHAPDFIPVILHNFRGYDSHIIVEAFGDLEIKARLKLDNIIKCIPNNFEKYMSVTLGKLRFIDSLQFMAASLDELVKGCSKFDNLRDCFGDKFNLLAKKGVFPYEYLDDWSKFDETSLPDKDKFYSQLKNENITDDEYRYAQDIWKEFDCETFGDYHDLYLKTDVLLLADVFESFREVSYNNYGLDPCWYYSAPGLSWDALLKFSKVRLELLTDVDMFNFIEKGIRGGISVITKKYAEANNKYLKQYNPDLPSRYLVYLDCNNLYGGSMAEPMPFSGFHWITVDRFLSETEKKIPDDVSYFVEVDLDYPNSLHKLHNDYPFCAESMVIDYSLLSKEQQALASPRQHSMVKKLVPNLLDKKNYVLHYKVLKQAVDAGLVLRKVHRVLKFNQSPWMRGYINSNTSRRAAAKLILKKEKHL